MSNLLASKLFDITGFVAIVTGGGTGIGLMIAKGLATNGAKVYITGRRGEVIENAARTFNESKARGELIPVVCDVTLKESILSLHELISKKEGKLHVLVNNAGQVGPTSLFLSSPNAPSTSHALGQALFDAQSYQQWSDHFSINVSSQFFMSVIFLGLLEEGTKDVGDGRFWSSIVNLSSISGIMKLAQDHFAYNAAKAASTHLSKLLGTEIAKKGIPVRVNSISPGAYASEMTSHQGDAWIDDETAHRISKGLMRAPAGRGGTEEEMVATVLYMVSRGGGFLNGQEIVIDGGFLMLNPGTR